MAGASLARVVQQQLIGGEPLVYCVADDGEILAYPASVYTSLPVQWADRLTPTLSWERAEEMAFERRARS